MSVYGCVSGSSKMASNVQCHNREEHTADANTSQNTQSSFKSHESPSSFYSPLNVRSSSFMCVCVCCANVCKLIIGINYAFALYGQCDGVKFLAQQFPYYDKEELRKEGAE